MQSPQSPDPLSDPKGYQTHLLGLLGDDDPAAVQAGTPPTLQQFAAEAGPYLPLRPEPAEWSALECIAHIVDAEIVMSARYRWVLAQDEPPLIGYDQDLWIDGLHADETDTDGLIDLFAALRLANVTLWRRTPTDRRQRLGRAIAERHRKRMVSPPSAATACRSRRDARRGNDGYVGECSTTSSLRT